MPSVKPEAIFKPLAPAIAEARRRGLSDDEITERLNQVVARLREAGIDDATLERRLGSLGVRPEPTGKELLRGLVSGLTLGYYVPESLKPRPGEQPNVLFNVPLPVIGDVSVTPETVGHMASSVVPFTVAFRAARPATTLAQRILGASAAGRITGEAARTGLAAGGLGLVEAGTPEERLTRGAVGAAVGVPLGGAAGLAREILMARRLAQVRPTEVLPAEPPPAPTATALPGRGFPQPLQAGRPPRALPPARIPLGGDVPTEPAQLPLPFDRPPDAALLAGGAQLDLFTRRVAGDIAKTASRPVPRQPAPAPAPPLQPATAPPPQPPPGDAGRLVIRFGTKTWVRPVGSQAEADTVIEGIKARVGPAIADRLQFTVEPTAAPRARPTVETPAGLRPERVAKRAEAVRLPEEFNAPRLADELDRKGLVLRVDHSTDPQRPFVVVADGGEVKRFAKLRDVVAYVDSLSDDVRASTFNKGLAKNAKLTPDEQQAILRGRGRRKVANRPISTDTDPSVVNQPPEPPPISGGSGLPWPDWVRRVLHLRGLGRRNEAGEFVPTGDGARLANALDAVVRTDPTLAAELRAGFAAPTGRALSWNPLDLVGQPQSVLNRIVRRAASELLAVEEAWDAEARQLLLVRQRYFANLTPDERRLAAQVVEGQVNPSAPGVTEAVRQAVGRWRELAADFAQRLGLPEWAEYLTRLTDMQTVYEMWRPTILAARRLDDLSETLRFKVGDEGVFRAMRRAFEKQDKWENLPRNVKAWFKERLLEWHDATGWEALPEFVRSRVPQEVFDRFLLKRTGGLPYEQDILKSFDAYVPIALKKIHLDGWLERWQPIANHLPGSATNPLSEGYYLRRLALAAEGKESVGLDRAADRLIRYVEDRLGRSLADPNLLSRIASRAAAWTYRGALGLDSAIINVTQSINTWAAGGTTPFLRGLMRAVASASPVATGRFGPELGVLRQFSSIYLRGEFGGPPAVGQLAALGLRGLGRRLAELDDRITRLALSPMSVAENVNRGIAFAAGMEEAAALGLDAVSAIRLGFAKASRVTPNLELTAAQWHAVQRVAQTQFAYSVSTRSPYLAGPLARLTTMFWSYPTRQLQFVTNNLAEGVYAMLTNPSMEAATRSLRFLALLGLMVGGAQLGMRIGANFENIFGVNGFLPRGFAGPVGLITQAYSLATTGRPVRDSDVQRFWRQAGTYLIPQFRYGSKVADAVASAERGFRTDELGRMTYQTTPYGELMRALGIEVGKSYRQRVLAREVAEQAARRSDERRAALHTYFEKQDPSKIAEFNQRWPELPITSRDLALELRLRTTPLVQRTGPLFLRHRALIDEARDEGESDVTP